MPRILRGTWRRRRIYACTTALVLLAPALAQAGDAVFSGGTGDWFDAANWASSSLPSSTDRAIIDDPVQGVIFGQSAVVETLLVGRAANGSLLIRDPLQTGDATLGVAAGFSGDVTVSGTLGRWTNDADLVIGEAGSGTLSILQSGSVASTNAVLGRMAGGSGILAVDGAGSHFDISRLLSIGEAGSGSVSITAGATVEVGADATLGGSASGSGSLSMAGSGSRMTVAGRMTVGDEGTGTLSLLSGAELTSSSALIGAAHGATGTATLGGLGTLWTVSDELALGTGSLSLGTSAALSTGSASIGSLSGETATVTLSGSGTAWDNSGTLAIGTSGTGSLSIGTGSTVSTQSAVAGVAGASSGSVSIDGNGSALTIAGDFDIGRFGSGSATVSGGATLSAQTITLAANAGSSGTLNIGADETSLAAGAGTVNAQAIRFGDGTGTLVLNHGETNYELAAQLSGTGTVKVLRGVTALTGDNSHDGQTTISSGATLSIGNGGVTGTLGHGDVVNNGSLIFNRTGTIAFDGDISGTGTLDKQGSGTLTLGGTSTYSGATTVSAGRLHVNGSLSSSVSVAAGAVLGGSGSVGSTNLASGATLQAEGLAINGNLALASGSTLAATIGTSGIDALQVSGTANLAGADLALSYESGGRLGNHYTLIDAANTSGSLGSLTVNGLSSRFAVTESMDADSVDLGLVYNGAGVTLTSASANSVHSILGSAFNAGTVLSGSLSAALASDSSDLQSRMTALAGESGASAGYMATLAMQSFLTSSLAESANEEAGFWISPRGGVTRFDGDAADGVSTASISQSGLDGGVRFALDDTWSAGLAVSGSQSRYSAKDLDASATGTAGQMAAFAKGRFDNGFTLSAAAGAGLQSVDTRRAPGAGDRVEGDFTARMAGVDAQAGWLIRSGDVSFMPFAGASYVYSYQPGYSEHSVQGSGNPALSYSDIERGTATLRAGLDAAYETQLAERPVTFNARLAYLDRRTEGGTANASFAALPGASYALASLAPEGGAVQAGLGAQMTLGPAARLRFDLAGEWGRDYQEWTAAFGLDIQW